MLICTCFGNEWVYTWSFSVLQYTQLHSVSFSHLWNKYDHLEVADVTVDRCSFKH